MGRYYSLSHIQIAFNYFFYNSLPYDVYIFIDRTILWVNVAFTWNLVSSSTNSFVRFTHCTESTDVCNNCV